MSGMTMVITGILILILSTGLTVAAEWGIQVKKRRIREQAYHIYQ